MTIRIRIGLPHAPRKAAAYIQETYGQAMPSRGGEYRIWYNAAIAGTIPAEFSNGRWSVDENDMPQIVAALGLIPAPAAPAKPSRKAVGAPVSVAA